MKIIKRFFMILIMACIFILYFFLKTETNKQETIFVSCVDGDTAIFEIDGKEEYVRFLAIDTLEKNKDYGIEASNYVCSMLKKASRITIEFEEDSYKDKYNRVLAWVYVDDKLIQKELVSKGYAKVKYVYGDYKYVDELYSLEEKAKSAKIGIWSDNYE